MSYLVALAILVSSAVHPIQPPPGFSSCSQRPLDQGTVGSTVLVCSVVR
jgi:hypothetical protein